MFSKFGAFCSNLERFSPELKNLVYSEYLETHSVDDKDLGGLLDIAGKYLSTAFIHELLEQTEFQKLNFECNAIMQQDKSDLAIAQELDAWCDLYDDPVADMYDIYFNEY